MDMDRTPLEVGECALSIGEHSVGFPPSRTGDQLVEAYLELITLVRDQRPEDLRTGDVDTLTVETGMEHGFIHNRVESHLRTV